MKGPHDDHDIGGRRPSAFTLIELLIAIGVVALLAAILFPMMRRAREQANQTACLSNLHQVGVAFTLYASANLEHFPKSAAIHAPDAADWIYWQAGRDLNQSRIVPYMSPFSQKSLRCPSDSFEAHRYHGDGGYYYSYSMNRNMSLLNLARIRNAAQKALLYEEDENTIDDGHSSPEPNAYIDLLSIRHDARRKFPDTEQNGLSDNGERRGNVAFCDGHAEYIERLTLHTPATYSAGY